MAGGLLEPLPSDLPGVEPSARLPRGFRAGAVTAGIKPSGRPDLAVVASLDRPLAAAATFTTNFVPAAPVLLSREHLAATAPEGDGRYGWVDAVISTAGCANAATGDPGKQDQVRLAIALAKAIGTVPEQTLALSTGLIGTRLPVDRIEPALVRLCREEIAQTDAGFEAVAEAMCTTDSRRKVASVELELPDAQGQPQRVIVSGVSKGVGMMHPRMATMLSLVLTDAAIEPDLLSAMLRPIVARTWNQLTVDRDTSTNDTVFLLASGASGAAQVLPDTEAAKALQGAIEAVARSLARQQAADGEGAATLMTCQVSGARDDAEARAVARSVVASNLLKAAVHGRDPNWGRIAAAAGNAQLADAGTLEMAGLDAADAATRGGRLIPIDPRTLQIAIAGTPVFAGEPLSFDAALVSHAMEAPEVLIRIDLGTSGGGTGEAYGCDLTEQYVIENSEYST